MQYNKVFDYLMRGPKVIGKHSYIREIHIKLSQLLEEHANTKIFNILVNVGTNHLSKDGQEDTFRSIRKLLLHMQQELPEASNFWGGDSPKAR